AAAADKLEDKLEALEDKVEAKLDAIEDAIEAKVEEIEAKVKAKANAAVDCAYPGFNEKWFTMPAKLEEKIDDFEDAVDDKLEDIVEDSVAEEVAAIADPAAAADAEIKRKKLRAEKAQLEALMQKLGPFVDMTEAQENELLAAQDERARAEMKKDIAKLREHGNTIADRLLKVENLLDELN
ncbi:MAG: hypothetical protein IJC70_05005, partial [Firmicutes bacterium]|nr:hypothetical protein [Bacillota bacterium]